MPPARRSRARSKSLPRCSSSSQGFPAKYKDAVAGRDEAARQLAHTVVRAPRKPCHGIQSRIRQQHRAASMEPVDSGWTCCARPGDTNASFHHQLYRRFQADDDPFARCNPPDPPAAQRTVRGRQRPCDGDGTNGVSTLSGFVRNLDQDEKACAPDVQRFCRKLMDQGDFTILACLKETVQSSLPRAATCWSVTGNDYRLSVRRRRTLIAQ
jgi:hypothetical protein